MSDLLEKRDRELSEEREELARVQAALLRAKSEVARLEKKEDLRRDTENELVHLR